MSERTVQALRHYLRRTADDAGLQSDSQLLQQFIEAKDHRAFEILLDRHGPMVLGTARRLVNNAADADDVFQATFLSLARLAKSIRRGQSVPNWLYTSTMRIAARARKRRAIAIESVPEPSCVCAMESDLAWREVRAALDEELRRLPERLRSPLLLCYLSGLSRDEAAERLGWSLGTLKRRLEEGRAALRQRLERRGISAAGLALAVLSPAALSATVSADLVASCARAVTKNEATASTSALVLVSNTTLLGVAMKAIAISLALFAVGVGIVAGFGHAQPASPAAARKAEEPKVEPRGVALDDPLPPGATMRLGTSRFRQGVGIKAMAVSPDGKKAYTCSTTSTRAFDLQSGLPVFSLKSVPGESVAVSPDGKIIVTKSELRLRVRDAGTGQELRTFPLPKNPWQDADLLMFTPDGQAVATISDGKAIHLIDIANGKTIRDFAPENPESILPSSFQTTLGLAFSSDGKLMASGGFDNDKGNYFARLWDVATGKELRRFNHGLRSYGIPSLAFSPDGTTLATLAHDGRLRLFAVETGMEQKVFPKDAARLTHGVIFSPDGKTVAASGTSLHLYDAATGEERLRIDRRASHLHFTDDGKTLMGAVDGAIYVWDTKTGKPKTPEAAADGMIEKILVTADGSRIVTSSQGGGLRIWNGESGMHIRSIRASRQQEIAISPRGRYLAWTVNADGGHVQLYDLAADQLVERFPKIKGNVQVLGFSPDEKTLNTIDHQNGMTRTWDIETGEELRSFQALAEGIKKEANRVVRSVASPNGKILAVACNERPGGLTELSKRLQPETIRLWDLATGRQLHQLEGRCASMTFSPDGSLLVISGKIWDVSKGKQVPELADLSSIVAFSCDGRTLASVGFDGVVQIWEVATWTERNRFQCPHERTTSLAFTPSGHLLCGGLDTTTLSFDLRLRPAGDSGNLEGAWNDMADRDARQAFQAQARFLAAPQQTVKLFAVKIHTVKAAESELLVQLIADLDNTKFAVREAASNRLVDLGERALPALEKAVNTTTSPELSERAKKLLGKLSTPTVRQILELRAVETLERIASDNAKNLLKQWADGVSGAVLTEAARASLVRMGRVSAVGK